jgi:hypothetical protein
VTDGPIEITGTDEALLAQCRVQTFRCRRERSQLMNKHTCVKRLRERPEALNHVEAPRVPAREPRSVKRRGVDSKVRRGAVKRLRRPPAADVD